MSLSTNTPPPLSSQRLSHRVGGGGERRALDGGAPLYTVIPEHDLPRVRPAQQQVRVEAGERHAHQRRLTVEHILGRVLLEARVPDQAHAVRVVRRRLVIVVAVPGEGRGQTVRGGGGGASIHSGPWQWLLSKHTRPHKREHDQL